MRVQLRPERLQHLDLRLEGRAAVARITGEVRVLVLSLRAIREGVTLTRANTVLMVEQFWTATHTDQAIARVHRIGSEIHDSIDAVFLHASDTFDEKLFELINAKRTIADLASKGEWLEADEDNADSSVVGAILDYIVNKN